MPLWGTLLTNKHFSGTVSAKRGDCFHNVMDDSWRREREKKNSALALHFRKEINTIRKTALLMSVMKSLFRLGSTLITGTTFIIIALMGNTLDLSSVFLILPLVKVLTNNFMGKIIGITRNLSEFSVTLTRVKVYITYTVRVQLIEIQFAPSMFHVSFDLCSSFISFCFFNFRLFFSVSRCLT